MFNHLDDNDRGECQNYHGNSLKIRHNPYTEERPNRIANLSNFSISGNPPSRKAISPILTKPVAHAQAPTRKQICWILAILLFVSISSSARNVFDIFPAFRLTLGGKSTPQRTNISKNHLDKNPNCIAHNTQQKSARNDAKNLIHDSAFQLKANLTRFEHGTKAKTLCLCGFCLVTFDSRGMKMPTHVSGFASLGGHAHLNVSGVFVVNAHFAFPPVLL